MVFGGTLHSFTSSALWLNCGCGLCTHSVKVTPGTSVTSVDICDAFGTVISSGR